ncbi:MAG: hypothetical protein SPF30_06675 [Arcanobacterium sp.]|nr:hypothetical protein [Arcanobacterium sp.]
MPNFNDHESNHSHHNEERNSQSSGWKQASSHGSHAHGEGRGSRSERGEWREARGAGRSGGNRYSNGRGSYRRDDSDRRGGYRGGFDRDRRDDRYGDSGSRFDRDERRGGFRGRDDERGGERRRHDRFDRRDDRRDDRRGDRREGFGRRDDRPDDGMRNVRGGEAKRARAKELQYEIPESITADMLPAETRNHLRGLNPTNADIVARHLAYAGEMVDIDPEVAYEHAKAAYARAARIDIVREAVGIAAYMTGRYSEALTELRAYRRFSDDYSHVAIEADAERGLGRSEKALRFISEIPLDRLDADSKVELAIVTSGAKADTGDSESGLRLIEKIIVEHLDPELAARVELVKADRLEELGRGDEAQTIREQWEPVYDGDTEDTDILVDLNDVLDDVSDDPVSADSSAQAGRDDAEVDDAEVDGVGLDTEFTESATWAVESAPELSDGGDREGVETVETAETLAVAESAAGIEATEAAEATEVAEIAEGTEVAEAAAAEMAPETNADSRPELALEAEAAADGGAPAIAGGIAADDTTAEISLIEELQAELGDDFDASEWGDEFSADSDSDSDADADVEEEKRGEL